MSRNLNHSNIIKFIGILTHHYLDSIRWTPTPLSFFCWDAPDDDVYQYLGMFFKHQHDWSFVQTLSHVLVRSISLYLTSWIRTGLFYGSLLYPLLLFTFFLFFFLVYKEYLLFSQKVGSDQWPPRFETRRFLLRVFSEL